MSLTSTYSLLSHTTEFQGNSFETGNQLLPDVTGLSNGGFVLAYNNPANGEIRVDFYNAAHERVGTSQTPDDGDSEAMGQPQVVELSNGNVLVVWDDNEAGDAGPKNRLYSAEGTPIGDEINLTPGVAASGVDHDIQVAALENGGFVVTHTIGGNIYQTRYTSDGIGIDGGSFQVNSGLPGDQVDSAVAALSNGGYVVTYTDTDPADQTIRARIYNANGTTHVHDFIVGSIGDNTQSKVIGLEGGKWAVVYTDTGWSGLDGGNSAVTLHIFDGNGENITPGSYIRVNDPSNQFETEPDIMVLENGFIAVSWTKHIDGADFDIRARVFTPEGVAVTGELNITTSFDTDVKSAVASLLSGRFVTAWQDSTTDGSGGRITTEVSEIVRTTTGDGDGDAFQGDELRDIVSGFGGPDSLVGGGGNDELYGGTENDGLNGGDGNDLLDGGAHNDNMFGGTGDDIYVVAAAGDTTIENAGEGTDTVRTYINWVLADNVERLELKGAGNLSGTGNTLNNTLVGNSGNNSLGGGDGNDYMVGGAGNDTLTGGGHNDRLIGGAGSDLLNGGAGDDTFDFDAVSDSPTGPALRDSIVGGFSHGFDHIDLTTIDANTLAGGNQAFSFIGAVGFSGVAGQLRYSAYGNTCLVDGDVNGDSVADFQIAVNGTHWMTGTDFVL